MRDVGPVSQRTEGRGAVTGSAEPGVEPEGPLRRRVDAEPRLTVLSEILAVFGWLLGAAGALLIAAGLLYAAAGWRYGGAVAIWTGQWGLPAVGIGLGLARFRRRGTSVVAVAAGLLALALIVLGEVSHAYDSYLITVVFDGAAISMGGASAIGRRRMR